MWTYTTPDSEACSSDPEALSYQLVLGQHRALLFPIIPALQEAGITGARHTFHGLSEDGKTALFLRRPITSSWSWGQVTIVDTILIWVPEVVRPGSIDFGSEVTEIKAVQKDGKWFWHVTFRTPLPEVILDLMESIKGVPYIHNSLGALR